MKQKVFTRPVSVTLSDDMFDRIKAITDHKGISISDYIRDAVREKLTSEKNDNHIETKED
jgi:metal-responsive CopG/Arc/MetJ family transcriptional regulator